MTSVIPASDSASLWALITLGTATALWLEQRHAWAARISGPVLALILAMLLSNTGLVPAESPAYDFVGEWLVPLAIPLLLIRANLREIIRSSGRLFLIFHVSSLGTLLGTFLAFYCLHRSIGMPASAHAAGMMAASDIGGGVNFMAVRETYRVGAEITNPLIVADNFVMAGLFIALLSIAGSPWFRRRFPHPHSQSGENGKASAAALAAEHWRRKDIGLLDIAKALAFAFVTLAISRVTQRGLQGHFQDVVSAGPMQQLWIGLCTNKFVHLTGITLVLASLFPRPLHRIHGPEELGGYLLAVFLFTLGLPADLRAVLTKAPLFFLFTGIICVVNLIFTLAVGKLFKLNLEELLLAVNANIGGAPSAAAMAISAGWPRLILPGVLVGIWGYVIGTPIGVMVAELLLASPP